MQIETDYAKNLERLKKLQGLTISHAVEDEYYVDGELFTESRGELQLVFNNDLILRFNCHIDAESILVKEGPYLDKIGFEDDPDHKWVEKTISDELQIASLGKIISSEIEYAENEYGKCQSACRLTFESGNFLHIWTIASDNIFWGLNEQPPYYSEKELKTWLEPV